MKLISFETYLLEKLEIIVDEKRIYNGFTFVFENCKKDSYFTAIEIANASDVRNPV